MFRQKDLRMKMHLKILIVFCALIFLNSCGLAPSTSPGRAPESERTSAPKLTTLLDPSRITKKPFGIFISPKNSPVTPERFSGYHTGADFETFEEEQTKDISVSAICEGSILQKRTASGYGGLVVQKCVLNGEEVTVIYGHLKYSSIAKKVNENVKKGEEFAILGEGIEADFERKHLHLGIHKGSEIDIRGYVSDTGELAQWLDPLPYIK